ncbi:hypothetical protein BDV23DRAFT_189077 [Aspergillus alliaceus]|uniref:Uncharacterized protein n=1 Tax=Petromyces alliaceus TaxID=209559 RepID=A0A5N7BS07_PETAA|nr:hypothetical protein BDV23DRAFT_189077 [Aspergillus alliaceus]
MHTEKPEVSMATKLLPQVHIAAIAEYYGVSPLAENANAKIENMLKTNWSPRGFSDVVTTALQSTRDRGLRETLGVVIAEHFDQLVEDEDILEVMDVGLAVAVVKGQGLIIQRTKQDLQSARSRLESVELESERQVI